MAGKPGVRLKPAVRSQEERNALVVQWQYLPRFVAKRLWHVREVRKYGMDDAQQAGCLGLLRAAELWDETRGIKFATYAYWAVARSILFEARKAVYALKVSNKSLEDANFFEDMPKIMSLSGRQKYLNGQRGDQLWRPANRPQFTYEPAFRDDSERSYEYGREDVQQAVEQLGDPELRRIFKERLKCKTWADVGRKAGFGRMWAPQLIKHRDGAAQLRESLEEVLAGG